MTASLGIAITTYNNCDLLMRQIGELRRLTRSDFELVVADDGSSDATVATLRASGVTTIAGPNRGVAWNKNRGLFYLLNKTDCRVILLLDDDILPVTEGWDSDWIEATERFGHVNYMLPSLARERVVAGNLTAASPGLATNCFGPLIGCTRSACGYVGYFDVRFGRWGFEHVDFTDRFVRLGYGGIAPEENRYHRKLYIVLSSGVELSKRASTLTAEEKEPLIVSGRKVIERSRNEPAYRCPWNSEEQRELLRAEVDGAPIARILTGIHSLLANFDAEPAGACSDMAHAAAAATQPVADRPAQRLFMIHIPKTGGDSVNRVLTESLGQENVLTHVESNLDLLTTLRSIAPGIRYVSGHHRLPDVLANMDRSKWFVFANFRNPVQHLISHLKWVKSLGAPDARISRDAHATAIQEMASRLWEISLNDIDAIQRFINDDFDDAKQYFDNCQVRYLIRYRNRLVDYADTMEAVDALGSLDFVGITERLSDTCAEIARAVGADPNIAPVPHANRSPLNEAVDLDDPAILDFYREAVRWDAFLYTAAKKAWRVAA